MKEIRRRCSDGDLYQLIAAAIERGATYRLTKAGIILFGPAGARVGAHFSHSSDVRMVRNTRARLRRAGML